MIKLVNNLYLDVDANNFMLKVKKVNSDKKSKKFNEEYFQTIGYFGSIGTLLKSAVIHALTEQDNKSLQEMEKSLNALVKDYKITIDSLNLEGLRKAIEN